MSPSGAPPVAWDRRVTPRERAERLVESMETIDSYAIAAEAAESGEGMDQRLSVG
jgi:hypothetical protein